MPLPVRHAIAAALGGVSIALAAAGWGLWLTRGPAGWPDLGIPAEGSDALLFCLNLMLIAMCLPTLAQGLIAQPPVAAASPAAPRPGRPRTALAVQLGVGAILLICLLPYVLGAPAWSPVALVRGAVPAWGWLALATPFAALSGVQCIRRALRAPAAPADGI